MLLQMDHQTHEANKDRIGYFRTVLTEWQQGRCMRCYVCAPLEVDHVTPRSLGGRLEWMNIQGLCRSCNAMKMDKVGQEWDCRSTLFREFCAQQVRREQVQASRRLGWDSAELTRQLSLAFNPLHCEADWPRYSQGIG